MYSLAHPVMSDFCDSLDCSPPGSSVHGIPQTKILEWVAIFFSRGSSRLRDQTCVSCISCIAGRFFTSELSGQHNRCVFTVTLVSVVTRDQVFCYDWKIIHYSRIRPGVIFIWTEKKKNYSQNILGFR